MLLGLWWFTDGTFGFHDTLLLVVQFDHYLAYCRRRLCWSWFTSCCEHCTVHLVQSWRLILIKLRNWWLKPSSRRINRTRLVSLIVALLSGISLEPTSHSELNCYSIQRIHRFKSSTIVTRTFFLLFSFVFVEIFVSFTRCREQRTVLFLSALRHRWWNDGQSLVYIRLKRKRKKKKRGSKKKIEKKKKKKERIIMIDK